MEVNPLSVILVKADSKGDRLLFRYPYQIQQNDSVLKTKEQKKNPYSVSTTDDVLQNTPPPSSNINNGELCGFTDEVLSTLFAVKPELTSQKFELKVNDVRFVSHPTQMQPKDESNGSILINVVFALHAQASYSIVKCYYELSKKLGYALRMEEERVAYLTEEMGIMVKTHDEVANLIEQKKSVLNDCEFVMILERSSLAQTLKSIYHDLCTTGLINISINQHVTLSFCFPQKAHQFHRKGTIVEPEAIDKCLKSLKPYHGMLLLVDFADLLDCVPPTGARILLQLVENYNPLKSLQNIASEANISIDMVYQIVGHLVYWAKATIIYPLCETNVYVIAPDASLHIHSHLVDKFSTSFPGMSLFEVISDFSLPTSIGHLTTPLQQPARQGILAQMVLWMLQHHLLMQIHTYVQFMPFSEEAVDGETEEILVSEEDDVNENDSTLSISIPVPHPSQRSYIEERLSNGDSTVSDNINVQPSSSHKSNYSMTNSGSLLSVDEEDDNKSQVSIEDEEIIKGLLSAFPSSDRAAVKKIPAAGNVEDLTLMVKLYQAGYFKGEHHLEEIMYFENLRRSQLLQLLDKFRDILIIYETEDPAVIL